jgi:phytoene dehydrogenase-like protein
MNKTIMEYDYIVVGGGISGLYTCLKLKEYESKALFETTTRLGGRLLTDKYMKFILDYGASRFMIPGHTNLLKLLRTLDIKYVEVDETKSVRIIPNLENFTKDETRLYNRSIKDNKNPMFPLLEYAIKKILGDQWDFETNHILDESRRLNMTYLKICGKFRGKPLWKYGMWDLLCLFLSQEALTYIKNNSTFYNMIEYNLNGLSHICYLLNILSVKDEVKLFTIDGGMGELVKKIEREVKSNTNIYTQHTLINIESIDTKLRLTFLNTLGLKIYVYTKRLFLCLNKSGIQKITGLPNFITDLTHSIREIKLFKIFAIVKNPPWKNSEENVRYINSVYIPCREIRYNYIDETGYGEVMLYGDYPTINYWNYYNITQAYQVYPEVNKNNDLKQQIVNILNRVFPDTNNFDADIVHYGIRDWSLPPFESGIHSWNPDINPYVACKDLKGFKIGENKVSVCGETFAFHQGYIESALNSVEEVFFSEKAEEEKEKIKHSNKHNHISDDSCQIIKFCKKCLKV